MSSSTVLVVTWVLAGLVVAAYVWFVVWRVRVDRRKKAAEAETAGRMTSAIDTAARLSAELQAERPPVTPAAGRTAVPPVAPDPVVAPSAAPAPVGVTTTVAAALAGIALPHDLVPLTTLSDRPGVGDRVAFWTDTAPAEIVGPAFADELERLGYSVSTVDAHSLSAHRDALWLLAVIHPDGRAAKIGDRQAFESVPDLSVVLEVWLPE